MCQATPFRTNSLDPDTTNCDSQASYTLWRKGRGFCHKSQTTPRLVNPVVSWWQGILLGSILPPPVATRRTRLWRVRLGVQIFRHIGALAQKTSRKSDAFGTPLNWKVSSYPPNITLIKPQFFAICSASDSCKVSQHSVEIIPILPLPPLTLYVPTVRSKLAGAAARRRSQCTSHTTNPDRLPRSTYGTPRCSPRPLCRACTPCRPCRVYT